MRFRFSKFKDIDGMGKEGTFVTETIAENLSSKTISGASFSLYIFDKSKARISERYVNLTNVAAGQTVKFQMTMSASWHSRFGGHRDERSADHVYHR
ncbi:MAG TPA: FxLYD domain-containing protein [Terriglobales bacterium]|nr:FxLYD domain-containing protein [Terriglobales bacterium]